MIPASAPTVSILIVNYNGASLLPACLNSLATVSHPEYEIVLVDNASQDNSLVVLQNYPQVRVIQNTRNEGFAGGNNAGLPACRGKYILLLNSDTIVTPDFLTLLCRHLDTHPQAGVAQARMILPHRECRLDSCGSWLTDFGFMYHHGFLKPDAHLYHRSYRVFSAKGACMLIRREAIAAAGGYLFDPEFFCYYEETDFCHRAWLAGYETHYVGAAVIQHLMGSTTESNQKKGFAMRHFLRNQIFSLSANLELTSALRILPFYFAFYFTSGIASLLRSDWPLAQAHALGVWSNLKNARKIYHQRRAIRKIRKLSDRDLFSRILRNPRPDYFLKTFQGRIGDYSDGELCPQHTANI
jgi:GT2 family glycosyltransferase